MRKRSTLSSSSTSSISSFSPSSFSEQVCFHFLQLGVFVSSVSLRLSAGLLTLPNLLHCPFFFLQILLGLHHRQSKALHRRQQFLLLRPQMAPFPSQSLYGGLCSVQGYNMDMYPQLRGINSQQSEQINRSFRSLSVILAHVTFDTYMKILELYFVYKNVKTRRKLNKG